MNFHPWRLRTKLGCSDSSSFSPIVKVGGGRGRTTKQSSNHAKGKPCLSLLQTFDDILEIRKILSILCEYVTTEKKKKNFRNYAFLVWGMRGEANINNLPSSLLPPPSQPMFSHIRTSDTAWNSSSSSSFIWGFAARSNNRKGEEEEGLIVLFHLSVCPAVKFI